MPRPPPGAPGSAARALKGPIAGRDRARRPTAPDDERASPAPAAAPISLRTPAPAAAPRPPAPRARAPPPLHPRHKLRPPPPSPRSPRPPPPLHVFIRRSRLAAPCGRPGRRQRSSWGEGGGGRRGVGMCSASWSVIFILRGCVLRDMLSTPSLRGRSLQGLDSVEGPGKVTDVCTAGHWHECKDGEEDDGEAELSPTLVYPSHTVLEKLFGRALAD